MKDSQGGGQRSVSIRDIKIKYQGKDVDWRVETSKMSPRSQNLANDYLEKVLRPKGVYTEDILDQNLIIRQEPESYAVTKFMMVTIKLVGNVIVCDDRGSVSIVDPRSMQKIASVPLPTENCYLYSVYKHELSSSIYLAFDSKQVVVIDSNKYTNKGSLKLSNALLKFTEFQADPKNYVILACEKGNIDILQPSRSKVVSSFNIEEAIKDYQREENGNNEDFDNLEAQVGDIIEVVPTIDTERTHEYMVLAREGLFFIKIKQIKKSETDVRFDFEFNQNEQYFKNKTVKGAFEYDSGKIIALVNGSRNIRFISRIWEKEDTNLRIANLSNDSDYRSLQPFPNYSFTTFPYVLIKDSKSLNVINVRTMQSRVILKDSLYNWDVLRTSMADF